MAAGLELTQLLSDAEVLHVSIARGYVLRTTADSRPNAIADATLAQVIEGVTVALRALLDQKPKGVILHLRDSLPVWGPLSVDSLGRVIALCCLADVLVAVTIGDNPLQRLQLSRLCAERGGPQAKAVALDEEALAFIRGGGARDPWAVSSGVRLSTASGPSRHDSASLPAVVRKTRW